MTNKLYHGTPISKLKSILTDRALLSRKDKMIVDCSRFGGEIDVLEETAEQLIKATFTEREQDRAHGVSSTIEYKLAEQGSKKYNGINGVVLELEIPRTIFDLSGRRAGYFPRKVSLDRFLVGIHAEEEDISEVTKLCSVFGYDVEVREKK